MKLSSVQTLMFVGRNDAEPVILFEESAYARACEHVLLLDQHISEHIYRDDVIYNHNLSSLPLHGFISSTRSPVHRF